jgi:hypothetical protein
LISRLARCIRSENRRNNPWIFVDILEYNYVPGLVLYEFEITSSCDYHLAILVKFDRHLAKAVSEWPVTEREGILWPNDTQKNDGHSFTAYSSQIAENRKT